MTVTFYSFSKRENSTAQPATAATTKTGKLREPCTITSPEIGFDFGISSAPNYNYAYISSFGQRYYWITEWTWDKGLWWASMRVDVLATYKTEIGNSNEYILRSSHSYNGYIIDGIYPATASVSRQKTLITPPWNGSYPHAGGRFIVGIVGQGAAPQSYGAVTYYSMTPSEFQTLMNELLSSTAWTGQTFTNGLSLDGLTEETFKALFNPMQYIVSCQWVPVIPTMLGTAGYIDIGWWTTSTAQASILNYPNDWFIDHIRIPIHGQSASRGEWLQMYPYTKHRLRYPPFGTLDLNPTLYIDYDYLCIWMCIDYVSGKASLVYGPAATNSGNYPDLVDGSVETQAGVPIALAQSSQDILGTLVNTTSALGGGISAAVRGDIGGAIANSVSGVVSAIESFVPSVSISGGNGNFSNYVGETCLLSEFANVADEDNTHLGRPVCTVDTISNYFGGSTGYIMIGDPDIAISGTADESLQIKTYMSNGFYYE